MDARDIANLHGAELYAAFGIREPWMPNGIEYFILDGEVAVTGLEDGWGRAIGTGYQPKMTCRRVHGGQVETVWDPGVYDRFEHAQHRVNALIAEFGERTA